MFTKPTKNVSNEHVNHIVTSILNKRQKKLAEQHQTFIQRDADENNKRNNYLLDRFTRKKRTISSKENLITPIAKLSSPKKKTSIEILDDDDDDFIAIKKRPKLTNQSKINVFQRNDDPIKECLESIVLQIENNDVVCPICNQALSNLSTLSERQQHVNQCLTEPCITNIESKHQKNLLAYSNFTHSIKKVSTTVSNLKCQICGMSFNIKRTYLSHLKKCSNQNSVQLKHIVNFASKTTTIINPAKTVVKENKQKSTTIKNRIIKMEMPTTEDDEQQQLAIALSNSIKTSSEPLNAFDILQAASKTNKTIDLLTTPLWNVSMEDKLKLCSTRLLDICERLVTFIPSENSYKFPLSSLQCLSLQKFGQVNWWNITTTDPHDDEIPLTQLTRILDDNDVECVT